MKRHRLYIIPAIVILLISIAGSFTTGIASAVTTTGGGGKGGSSSSPTPSYLTLPPTTPQNIVANSSNVKKLQCQWVDVEEIDCTFPDSSNQQQKLVFIGAQDSGLFDTNCGGFTCSVTSTAMDDFWSDANGTNSSTSTYDYYSAPQCNGGGVVDKLDANPYNSLNDGIDWASIYVEEPNVAGQVCQGYSINTSITTPDQDGIHQQINIPNFVTDSGNSNIFYYFSGNNIVRIDGDGGYVFAPSGIANTHIFIKQSQASTPCPDEILYYPNNPPPEATYSKILGQAGNGNATLWPLTSGNGTTIPSQVDAGANCGLAYNLSDVDQLNGTNDSVFFDGGGLAMHIGGSPAKDPGVTGFGVTQNSTPNTLDAKCQSSGDPFSWLMCGFIDEVGNAETYVINVVQELLKTNTISFSSSYTCSSSTGSCTGNQIDATIYTVWSNIRVFGDILLVIAILIVVYAETLGGGGLEAFSAKRMLPRILAAAILINLSIYLIAAMEDVTNILGSGVSGLIESPFQGVAHSLHVTLGVGALTGSLSGVAIIGGALVGTFALGFVGLLMFIITSLFLAAMGILITVMIRQILLLFLLLLSPVAFAMYCLPNTQQYFKKYWDLLIKTLMVYPIVMVVITMAEVSYIIIDNLGIQPAFLSEIMSILAACAPLFLIPFAFKMSGGVVGQVYQGVNRIRSRAQKGINSLAMKRGKERLSLFDHNGKFYNEKGRFKRMAKLGNKLGAWAGDPGGTWAATTDDLAKKHKRLRFMANTKGKIVKSKIHALQAQHAIKVFEELNNILGNNDQAYRAFAGMFSEWIEAGMKAASQFETDEHGNLRKDANGNYVYNGDSAYETKHRNNLAIFNGLKEAGFIGEDGQGGYETKKTIENAEDVEQMASILDKGGDTQKQGATALRASKDFVTSMYQTEEFGRGNLKVAAMFGIAQHGFAAPWDLKEAAEHLKDEEGMDFASSMLSRAQFIANANRSENRNGYGILADNGEFKLGVEKSERDVNGNLIFRAVRTEEVKDANGNVVMDAAGKPVTQVIKQEVEYDYKLPDGTKSDTVQAAYMVHRDAKGKVIRDSRVENIGSITYANESGFRSDAILNNLSAQKLGSDKGDTIRDLATAIMARATSSDPNTKFVQRQQLMSFASPYSGASADVQREAMKLIRQLGMQTDQEDYARRQAEQAAQANQGAPPPTPGAAGITTPGVPGSGGLQGGGLQGGGL